MKYFIPYSVSAKINYVYYFCLLSIAKYNKETKRYDKIEYKSIQELTEQINKYTNINISFSTVSRFLREMEKEEFNCYLSIDKENKIISIKNDFRKRKGNSFVVID